MKSFSDYTWVFYSTLAAGALIGAVAVRFRQRDREVARRAWMVVGALGGGAVAAGVFLSFFALSAVMSIGFSPIPPVAMFWITLLVVAAGALGVALSPPRS
jgi:hypothetical protein